MSGWDDEACAEEIEAGATIHLPLHELELGDLAGHVQDQHKQRMAEIIAALNDLFGGVTEGDRIVCFDGVRYKMLENTKLQAQAAANTK